jgi:tetratricopeptide (TPR) repeat protein
LKIRVPPYIFPVVQWGPSSVTVPTPMRLPKHGRVRLSFLLILGLLAGEGFSAATSVAQSTPSPQRLSPKPGASAVPPAEVELRHRIAAAQAAQAAKDPTAVAQANKRLIALGLRELAQLRLLQSAYAQAIELYRRSLEFEDVAPTRVDLAIAELQGNHPEDARADAEKALAQDSKDARALNIRGQAWAAKREYGKAAEAFEAAVQVHPDIETFYSLGITLLQSKDPRDRTRASEVFRRMVRLAGESGSLHVLFGRAYRDANDMPKAIQEFQKAVALDPKTPHAHYFLALAKMAVNEWKATPEIKQEMAKELVHFPHDYLANYMLGFIASGERQYDVADKYLNKAIEANPNWPEPYLYLGLNYYAQEDNKNAETMFRKAIELTGTDESRSNFQIRRAYVDLGRILATSGRTEESAKYVAKARDLQNKTMQNSQQNVAAIALAGGAGSAAAIVPLNSRSEAEAAPIYSGDSDPFAHVDASVMARANLTEQQKSAADAQESRLRSVLGLGFNDLATSEAVRGEFGAALTHYQEAERWGSEIAGLAKNLGLAAFRIENYPEAARGLSKAIEENPDNSPVRAMLGMAYFGSDKYVDAAKTFAPLGVKGMQDAGVGFAWASSLVHTGDLKKASEVLLEYERSNQSTEALLSAGQLWIEANDYQRAVDDFHRALKADPSIPKAHYFAGQAYLHWEHWPEAADEFQAELKLNPEDAEAKYNLGFVYLEQSKVDDAVTLFREVVSSHPDHANAQYQLGKILLDRGQVAEAVDFLEKASHLSPQADYMHYQLQAAYRKQSRFAEADREMAIYKDLKARKRESLSQAPGTNQ